MKTISWELLAAVNHLACSAEVQLAAFPPFIVVADELALLFSDSLKAQDLEEISSELAGDLLAIDSLLEKMTAAGPSLWTNDALFSSRSWSDVRVLSEAFLRKIGREIEAPDLSWVEYVGGESEDLNGAG